MKTKLNATDDISHLKAELKMMPDTTCSPVHTRHIRWAYAAHTLYLQSWLLSSMKEGEGQTCNDEEPGEPGGQVLLHLIVEVACESCLQLRDSCDQESYS